MKDRVVYYGARASVSDAVKEELAKCEKAGFILAEVKGLPANFKFPRPHETIRENGEVLFVVLGSRLDAEFFRMVFAHHMVSVDPQDPFNSFIVLHELLAA